MARCCPPTKRGDVLPPYRMGCCRVCGEPVHRPAGPYTLVLVRKGDALYPTMMEMP